MLYTPANIALEGDIEAALAWIPQARALLEKTRGRAGSCGLGQLRAHQRLSEDAYCYAVVSGGQAALRIVAGPVDVLKPSPVSLDWKVPDFLSGVVINGKWAKDPLQQNVRVCDKLWPTPECARLFKLNTINKGGPQLSKRLAVELWTGFGTSQNTQYAGIHATLWTGLMRKAVQALLGFGKPGRRSIYSDHKWRELSDYEARQLQKEKAAVRKGGTSAYERSVAEKGRQIRFDYRYYRTHGISKGQDGKLWLVEIGLSRGVVAMPLPMYPKTLGSAFADKVKKLNDSMGRTVLDELGGFPTGEAFPATPEGFDAWVRAGAVQRLRSFGDMQPFYQKSPYSSVFGWAFNGSGSEAHNTCYAYGDDHVMVGYHYAVDLNFGALRALERTDAAVKALRTSFLPMLKQYPKRFDAAMAKLTRITDSQLGDVVGKIASDGLEAGFLLLDGQQCAPWATATAVLRQVEQGPLYTPNAYPNQPQFKVPEPAINGLLTFDFTPDAEHPWTVQGPADFDTTLFVTFLGDQMELVRMSASSAGSPPVETDDRDGCTYMGAWTIESAGAGSVPTMFYTSSIDDRREVVSNRSTTRITSSDMGYTAIRITDHMDDLRYCTARKVKTFLQSTTTVGYAGSSLGSAVLVPFGDRAAYYYAVLERDGTQTRGESQGYVELNDATKATGYRASFSDFLGGHGIVIDTEIPECGNNTARRVVRTFRDAGECSDMADEGEWCSKCDNLDNMAYDQPLPPIPPSTSTTTHPARLHAVLVYGGDFSPLTVQKLAVDDIYYEGGMWFAPSPDPESHVVQTLFSTSNQLGDSTVVQYMEEPNTGLKLKGGPLHDEMDGQGVTFVGVV